MGIIADKYNEIFNAVPFKDDPMAYPAKEQYRNTGETRARTYNAILEIENLIDTKQEDLEVRLSSNPEDPDGTKIAQIQALKRLKLLILGDISQEFNTLEKVYNYTKNELANRYLKSEVYSKAETYNKQEIDNQHSAMIYELDWKEAVKKYADILTTYPTPDNGWTVNTTVGDPTNHTPPAGDPEDGEKPATWRYNGTDWIKIDAGSIPKATISNDGLLPAEWVAPIMNLPTDTLTELNKKANKTGDTFTGGVTIETAGPNHFKSTNTVGTVTSTFGTDATSGIIETIGAGYYKQHKRGNHEMNNPLGDFIFGTTKNDGTYPDFTFTNKDSNPLVVNGKDLATGKIHYENIGSKTETIDILEWAKTAMPGFYRSISGSNLFTNLPENVNTFELTITTCMNEERQYRTVQYKPYNRNNIWINTYNPEIPSWLGWTKLLDTNNIAINKMLGEIKTKEEADALFNNVHPNNIYNGIYLIRRFNVCFPNDINQKYDYGYLQTYADINYNLYMQTYMPRTGSNDAQIVTRIGTKQENIVVWGTWAVFNQQITSGGSSETGYWVKFVDGTLIQYGVYRISSSTEITYHHTFPIAFIDDNVAIVAGQYQREARASALVDIGCTKTGAMIVTNNKATYDSGNPVDGIKWVAIGRWK